MDSCDQTFKTIANLKQKIRFSKDDAKLYLNSENIIPNGIDNEIQRTT